MLCESRDGGVVVAVDGSVEIEITAEPQTEDGEVVGFHLGYAVQGERNDLRAGILTEPLRVRIIVPRSHDQIDCQAESGIRPTLLLIQACRRFAAPRCGSVNMHGERNGYPRGWGEVASP